MRAHKFSKRTKASATLLAVGLAMASAGIYQLCRFYSPMGDLVAICLYFVGGILIGAGALSPFGRPTAGGLGGFVVAAFLVINPIRSVGTNANKTFEDVAKELGAAPAEREDLGAAAAELTDPSDETGR